MRPISWLHLSDLHLRKTQSWAQDVVLTAMCKDIERRRCDVGKIDFVLATGDLAFSGKELEYVLVADLFDEVARVADVPPERIFCVPGNHDVDRDRQKMCFTGTRSVLLNQNQVDLFFDSSEELNTLLLRQENFRHFRETYFSKQERTYVTNGLAYVSIIPVEDLRIAIVGLNTAWLSEGGLSDHGKLLAGERQVIDALNLASEQRAHIVIAMGHHPFHVLSDFDRRPVQRRIEETCHFYHCGHLHDPEYRETVLAGAHCLNIATGATFESRHVHNAYSLLRLDVMQAQQTVRTIKYLPNDGAFSDHNDKTSLFVINAVTTHSVSELGAALASYRPTLEPIAYFLSALLLEAKDEVPIPTRGGLAFGSLDLLRAQEDSELKLATIAFMAIRNPLRLLGESMSLTAFFERYGVEVERYGSVLSSLCDTNTEFRKKLAEREADARSLAQVVPLQPFAHTLALMQELAAEGDWPALRQQAERSLESSERSVVVEARRMLALCCAQHSERSEQERAVSLYRELVAEDVRVVSDFAALASLLVAMNEYEEATNVLLTGMRQFPSAGDWHLQIGQEIVLATGDRSLRDALSAYRAGRRTA